MTQTVKEIISTFDHLPLSEQNEVTKILLRRRLGTRTKPVIGDNLVEVISEELDRKEVIEINGTIDENHQLVLDEKLPEDAPNRVRVIVLLEGQSSNTHSKKIRKAGTAAGLINISSDFDAPLEEFEEYQP